MRYTLFLLWAICTGSIVTGQKNSSAKVSYRGTIHREDGAAIVFRFDVMGSKASPVMYIINGKERIRVDSIAFKNDSVFIKMPVFESQFRAAVANRKWSGEWLKETSKGWQAMPFTAEPATTRFAQTKGAALNNVTGRWEAHFKSDANKKINAMAELVQHGNLLTGSFLTTTGDYRYLEGIVTGKRLIMSAFDGGHAFLFTADIANNNTIENGKFLSGKTFVDEWTAVRNPRATIPPDASAMYVKPGESSLNFSFPDLDSNMVSINDTRFKNKVVVVQIMGSWCPNCMDETAFLSEYYQANKQRGVEVIGLAYEYGTSFAKARQGLQKFQRRFNVQYPLLFTGVSMTDSLRTEKTLPQLTSIKVFPSTIFIGKNGTIKKLDNGFNGPGTGEHYTAYKKEFNATIDELLKE